ncbi:hypothetical protein PAPYR_11763 [Paratrimastix pyriformis]|uniref:NADH dehydrogenase subunit 6 n=1 Tax=Paratrimastix pyriformis TaxID=342808 RepID=A0ABQ8U326_9EUKA|nr:hypothetical protein PAPYR_11763 [Paratrimastix pyriformis]
MAKCCRGCCQCQCRRVLDLMMVILCFFAIGCTVIVMGSLGTDAHHDCFFLLTFFTAILSVYCFISLLLDSSWIFFQCFAAELLSFAWSTIAAIFNGRTALTSIFIVVAALSLAMSFLSLIFMFMSSRRDAMQLPGAEIGFLQTDLPIVQTALLFYLSLVVVVASLLIATSVSSMLRNTGGEHYFLAAGPSLGPPYRAGMLPPYSGEGACFPLLWMAMFPPAHPTCFPLAGGTEDIKVVESDQPAVLDHRAIETFAFLNCSNKARGI